MNTLASAYCNGGSNENRDGDDDNRDGFFINDPVMTNRRDGRTVVVMIVVFTVITDG